MKTLTFESNFGQFEYTVQSDVEVGDKQAAKLATLGLGALVGAAGAAMEKVLWQEGGATKRPEKWTRTDAAYSDTLAKAVQNAGSRKLDEITKEKGLPSVLFEVTGEYVSTEGKRAHEMAKATLATLTGQPPEIVNAFGVAFGGLVATDSEEEKLAKLVKHFSRLGK